MNDKSSNGVLPVWSVRGPAGSPSSCPGQVSPSPGSDADDTKLSGRLVGCDELNDKNVTHLNTRNNHCFPHESLNVNLCCTFQIKVKVKVKVIRALLPVLQRGCVL